MQRWEEMAATSVRSDWATAAAAAAVFSQGVTFTSLPSFSRKAVHWLMAWGWEKISLMSSSLVPFLATRLWSTFSRVERTILKLLWRSIRS